MKHIKLSQGKFAIVDNDLFEELSKNKWHVRKGRNTYYAHRFEYTDQGRKNIHMHRIIANTPDNLFTDHINRNGLDNRRCNLRHVTNSQNHFNQKIRITNTSGHIGIDWLKNRNKWRVRLGDKHLGVFDNINDAIECHAFHFKNLPLPKSCTVGTVTS